jgi:predicted extracellular nuclease
MAHTRRWSASLLVITGMLTLIVAGVRTAAAAPTELFFSEYVEGSSNNKALEIYNGTGAPVDLAAGGYTIQIYANGSTTGQTPIALAGTIANGDVFVIANNQADPAILAQTDQQSGGVSFNGDDTVVLRKGDTIADSIGQIGVDPGIEWGTGDASTADNTLRRKLSVEQGDTNPNDAFDPSVEWNGYPQNTFDGLGTYNGGDASPSPTPSGSPSPTPTPAPSIIPIGTVQGSVADTDDGTASRSPYAGSGSTPGQTVTVQGVIYQRTLARTGSGGSQYGFFIQNTAATDDNDPNSSDGIFVFMGSNSTLIGGYAPQVGNEVVVQGRVVEFNNLTQLSSATALQVLRSGVVLNAEVSAFDANPPADLAAAYRYWERREGMRGQVPANSVVLNGRNVFPGTEDAEVWVARPDSTIAQRRDPYARRAFRDPHPLDDRPEPLFDNGNGYRILMGSLGVKAATGDNTTLLAPARTFDTLTNAPVGGVYYSFGKYLVQVEQQLDLRQGVDPSLNAPPQAFNRAREYSVANYNVENLYDYRDDPFDGCDFTGNTGCEGVRPPFDYVPASNEAYQERLRLIATQIITDIRAPDILLVQEAEDQDICTVVAGVFTCGATNNADGKPDTLQELATVIARSGGPAYDAVYDRNGADARGIVSAFLYRTDRVQLLPVNADNAVLGSTPQVRYRGAALAYNADVQNPKALNAQLPSDVDRSTGTDGSDVFTRAPQVGLFRVWRDGVGTSVFTDLYTVSNHFSSGPDRRVGQRREQAAYNAAIVDALQEANAAVRVVLGGDLNVFPRPDDPFAPGDTRYPSDQLAPLYEQGLTNMFDVLVREVPASAYSYVFQGQAQTLDHQFLTPAQLRELVQARVAHINSDWPAEFDGDGSRGASDHDPLVTRHSNLPTVERLLDLVTYFEGNGQIDAVTADQLRSLLQDAQAARDRRDFHTYREKLLQFIQRLGGTGIGDEAEEVLKREAQQLLGTIFPYRVFIPLITRPADE